VATFNRAPDATGLNFWVDSGMTIEDIADTFFLMPETQEKYPEGTTDESFVTAIYQNVFNRTPDEDGLAFWVGEGGLGGGVPRSEMILTVIGGAQNGDAEILANKTEVGLYFADELDLGGDGPFSLSDVTADEATVVAAKEAADELVDDDDDDDDDEPGVVGEDFTLTIAADRGEDFEGTENEDTFEAPLGVNLFGLTANTLQSADSLDGGADRDSLWAELIQEGANSRDNSGRAIEPSTEKIEELYFNARETNINDDFAADNTVTVNGRKMLDVDYVESYYSDADLSVRGLTTNKSDGGNTRLDAITVSMDHTAGATDGTGPVYEPGDVGEGEQFEEHYINGHFEASSMKVLFEQNYLTPTTIAGTDTVVYELMNMDAVDEGFDPLLAVNVERFEFQLDGERYDLSDYFDDTDTTGEDIATYADLEAELNTALAALIADNPGVEALERVTITRVENAWTAEHPDTSNTLTGDQIIISAPTTDGLEASEFWAEINPAEEELVLGGQTVRNSARIERANEVPGDDTQELRINIDLEKVGRGEDGGGLIVGGDNYTKGFEIFDVTVKGNSEMPSSLAYLLTTPHDGLEELNITTAEADEDDPADLQIGNTNTPIYSIIDVNDINATTFLGDLDINQAYVVTGGEYDYNFGGGDDNLELFIENFAPLSADGVVFDISMGAGDDTVDVDLDGDAVDTIGDSFAISTNSGDDSVTVQMDPGVSQATMADLDNLDIFTGAGDDIVNLDAYGNFYIETGAGSDFVYINSKNENGDADTGLWNFGPLTSGADTFGDRVLYKAQLTVSFAGFESTVDVDTDKQGNFVADQMTINQAIIDAIEANYELSALLETELSTDSQRLTVTSIAGGLNDLGVALYQPQLVADAEDITTDGQAVLEGGDLSFIRQGLIDTTALDSAALEDEDEVVTETNVLGNFYGSIDQNGDGDQSTYAYITSDIANEGNFSGADADSDGNTGDENDIFALVADTADLFQDFAAGDSQDSTTGVNFSTINVGDGSNDIVVMHSNYANSANVLEITQTFGKVSVLNFQMASPNDVVDETTVSNHAIDFSTYLNNTQDATDVPAGNDQSTVAVPVTLNIVAGTEAFGGFSPAVNNNDNDALANSVNVIRFKSDDDEDETFAGLTDTVLLAALNDAADDGTTDYGNLDQDLLTPANFGSDDIVQTAQKHIVMVENGQNEGEYKVFVLTSSVDDDGVVDEESDGGINQFASADLLGTLDFGASVNLKLVGSDYYDAMINGGTATGLLGDDVNFETSLIGDADDNNNFPPEDDDEPEEDVTIERVLEGADQIQVVGPTDYTVDSVEEVGGIVTVAIDVDGTKYDEDFVLETDDGKLTLRVNNGETAQTATMDVATVSTFNDIVGAGSLVVADAFDNTDATYTDLAALSIPSVSMDDTDNAVTIDYADAVVVNNAANLTFADDDAVTVTRDGIDVLTALDATAIGGASVTYDADGDYTIDQADFKTAFTTNGLLTTAGDAITVEEVTVDSGDFVEAATIDLLDANDTIEFDGNAATLDAAIVDEIFGGAIDALATAGDELTVTMGDSVEATEADDIFDFAGDEAANAITEFNTAGTDLVDIVDVGLGTLTDVVADDDFEITNDVVYFITDAADDTDAVGSINAAIGGGTITDTANDAFVIIADAESTSIYSWTGDAQDDNATGDTLTLIGTIDDALVAGDFVVA
jgi:hypothetical protein